MKEILYYPPNTNPMASWWDRFAAGYLTPRIAGDVVALGDGTALLPTYTFLLDFDTGMYRVGANQLGFTAQGAQVAGIYNDAVADQILLVDRDCTNPAYSFLLDRDTGMYRGGNDQVLMAAGAAIVCGFYNDATANQVVNTDGSDANPSYSFLNERDTGIFRVGANELGFAASAGHVASIYGNLATERQIRLVDGVVTRPAYSFLNDTNLGFYRVGVDIIGVALANALDFQFSPNTFTGLAGSSMVMDTMTIATGSITDSSGAISFGNEALTTTGAMTANSFITASDIGIAAHTDLIQLTGANTMLVNGTLQSTAIGIGIAPNSAYPLYIYNNALDTANAYTGIYNYQIKTLGASDYTKDFKGIDNFFEYNQNGGEIGYLIGARSEIRHTDGVVGEAGANNRSIQGYFGFLDLNAGTVTRDIIGIFMEVDQEAAHTISGNAYLQYLVGDYDGTVTGTSYMIYLDERTGIDYGIYQSGTAPSVFGGTINGLTLTSAATGFTIAGGTTPKTLTVDDDFVVSTQLAAIAASTSHAADNTQAHSDYLINNGNDSTTGALTVGSLITASNIGIAADTDIIQLTGANAMTLNGALTLPTHNIILNTGYVDSKAYYYINGTKVFNIDGTSNILLGDCAANYTGSYGVAIGAGSMGEGGAGCSGSYNFFLGYNCGGKCTSGNQNIGIGAQCFNALNTGIFNCSVGTNSSVSMTSARYNTALGFQALYTVLTEWGNVGIGFNCARYYRGQYSVLIGYESGRGGTGATYTGANYNTCVGYNSGYALVTNQTGCVFYGNQAGRYETGSNTLMIDNQARTNEATARISAMIYGEFNATVANQILRINAALELTIVKSGATQAAAGAAANEVWKTASHASLPDNVLMIGV